MRRRACLSHGTGVRIPVPVPTSQVLVRTASRCSGRWWILASTGLPKPACVRARSFRERRTIVARRHRARGTSSAGQPRPQPVERPAVHDPLGRGCRRGGRGPVRSRCTRAGPSSVHRCRERRGSRRPAPGPPSGGRDPVGSGRHRVRWRRCASPRPRRSRPSRRLPRPARSLAARADAPESGRAGWRQRRACGASGRWSCAAASAVLPGRRRSARPPRRRGRGRRRHRCSLRLPGTGGSGPRRRR